MTRKPRTIELNLELTPAQATIDANPARFKVVEAGKRFGKTEYGLYTAARWSAQRPNSVVWYVAPTYRQAKDIAWRRLLSIIPPSLVMRRNETSLSLELPGSRLLELKGSDNPDYLRGPRLDGVVMEEAAYQKEFVWTDIFRGQLADRRGPALFISTPRGKNWFHRRYEHAVIGKDPEWAGFHYTINDNPHITGPERASIKAEVSDLTWRQEYMAEVLALTGLVYEEFQESSVLDPADPMIAKARASTVMVRCADWAIGGDDTAVLWLHVLDDGRVVVTDEHVQGNWSVPRHAEVIHRITGARAAVSGNDVLDSSAFRNFDGITASIGRQFAQQGVRFVPAERDVDVGIEIAKRFMQGSHLLVCAACVKLLKAVHEWEHGDHEPDPLAALRYGLTHIYRKRLTNLVSGQFAAAKRPVVEEMDPNSPVDAAGRYLLRRPRAKPLAWNYEAGCPL